MAEIRTCSTNSTGRHRERRLRRMGRAVRSRCSTPCGKGRSSAARSAQSRCRHCATHDRKRGICCAALRVTANACPAGGATFCAMPFQPDRQKRTTPSASRAWLPGTAAALETAASLLPETLPDDVFVGEGFAGERPAVNDDRSPAAAFAAPTFARGPPRRREYGCRPAPRRCCGRSSPRGAPESCCCRAGWPGGACSAARFTGRLTAPLDEFWQTRCRRLVERLGIRLGVELLQSARVDAPAVVGCLRPVILLPLGLVTGLPVSQVEAILAGGPRTSAATISWSMPVICDRDAAVLSPVPHWWISARIRAERSGAATNGDRRLRAQRDLCEGLDRPGRTTDARSASDGLHGRRQPARTHPADRGRRRASDVVGGWLAGTLAIAVPLVAGGAWASGAKCS